jgi:hypothetical protein
LYSNRSNSKVSFVYLNNQPINTEMKKTFIAITILGLALTSCSQYDRNRIEDTVNTTAETLGYEPEVVRVPVGEDDLAAQREREAQLMSEEYYKCAWCGQEEMQREMELDDEGHDFCSRKCMIDYQKNDYE